MCRTCLECVPLSELRSTTKAANCESRARNMKQKSSGTCGKKLGAGVPLDGPRPPPVEDFMRLPEVMQVHRHSCDVLCSLEERFLCPFASVAHCQKSAQQYKSAAPWSVASSRSKTRTRRRQGETRHNDNSRLKHREALPPAYRAVEHNTKDLTAGNSPQSSPSCRSPIGQPPWGRFSQVRRRSLSSASGSASNLSAVH